MNLPNKLTILRIIMIPLFVAAFYLYMIPGNMLIATGIFALAAFTDFLDGYIARKYNLVTDMGKFLDPIADKVLVSTALIICLIPPTGVTILIEQSFIGAIIVALILARELMVSGFRLVASGKGMVIAADKSGKIKTFFTDITIILMLVSGFVTPSTYDAMNIVAFVALCISGALTVYSGIECLVKNRDVLKESK